MVVEESGTTFQQNLLGRRGVNTVDPRNIEAILSTNFNDYSLGLRAPTFQPVLGSGIFTQDGAAWRRSRQLLRPQFASNRVHNFDQVKKCVQHLIESIPDDGMVDLQPLFFKLTFDTTMFLLFGNSVNSSDWGEVAGQESEFAHAFNSSQEYLSHRGRLGPFYWLLNSKAFRDACKSCHDFMDSRIAKALEAFAQTDNHGGRKKRRDADSYVFVEALIQQTRDAQVLRDQCLNVLLAGRDTTACCLHWTFRLLAHHEHVLDKLRREIDQISGLGPSAPPPTREDLRRMSYLQLPIGEIVLRLYPSVPVNSREAIRLTTLPVGGGPDGKSPVLVRPGEGVGYCVYAMHRRKDIYGHDADEFRPERWEGECLRDIGWAYLPFNGGPRLCLGQEFALLEVAYTVARLVQVFPKIKLPPGEPAVKVGQEKQILTLVVASAEGCRVSLKN
ncbi:Cytochrome P450 [Metarhizium album ARSEF 1941]|uniref:Cytochrome P450 n=1 Tax=Metarhizium album (strain ARSEF 1941) TaxID=1081103 RepID=A0A0B2WXV1_METAS|nr:Cytochrome P450 [Metarhizium album ARSEF 1941]KHN98863.1 Cytochrome P450 [Metarhizium album ARSEF 1941]